jgi:hypothetical protein
LMDMHFALSHHSADAENLHSSDPLRSISPQERFWSTTQKLRRFYDFMSP